MENWQIIVCTVLVMLSIFQSLADLKNGESGSIIIAVSLIITIIISHIRL